MLTYAQALLLGLLQGLTELFPISSLGHSVLVPALLGWHLDQGAPFFLAFLIGTHLATALALVLFYLRDWLRIAGGFFRSLATRRLAGDTYARLAWLIILATIPAGLLGLLFQHKLQDLFAAPVLVASFLTGNGILLLAIELFKPRRILLDASDARAMDTAIANRSFAAAVGAGLMQSLALFPGFSRTGSTLAGGLLAGLDHESAARFSFLLATPIILAAAVLKLPHMLSAGHHALGIIGTGMAASFVAALLSVAFLTRYFRTRTLVPFGVYCVVAGALSLAILLHA